MLEKLDKVYVCRSCGATFLFKDDCRDHQESVGVGESHSDSFDEMMLID